MHKFPCIVEINVDPFLEFQVQKLINAITMNKVPPNHLHYRAKMQNVVNILNRIGTHKARTIVSHVPSSTLGVSKNLGVT
ncbi:hypothetical protein V6N11_060550 [Hibiscus sabdariffa]|uniref:Uncharacterized protein n=1 Tax=Hibiscus sabdariffa TaxID=183260 RepID=A0ABR2QR90_9ROSI